MDVIPDRGLLDFIDGLDVKAKDTSLDTKVCDKEEEKEEETDVWQDIADALNNWTHTHTPTVVWRYTHSRPTPSSKSSL